MMMMMMIIVLVVIMVVVVGGKEGGGGVRSGGTEGNVDTSNFHNHTWSITYTPNHVDFDQGGDGLMKRKVLMTVIILMMLFS